MKRYITEILLLFHLIFKESTSRAKVQNLLTRFFSFLRFLHIINPWGPMHRLTKSHDSITYIKHVICKKQNMLSCHSENFEAQNLLRYHSSSIAWQLYAPFGYGFFLLNLPGQRGRGC